LSAILSSNQCSGGFIISANYAEAFLKALQIAPRFLIALAVIGLTILLLPPEWAALFGVDNLRVEYRPWIGVVTIASLILWAVHYMARIPDWMQKRRRVAQQKRSALKNIETLAREERLLLAFFLYHGAPTRYIPVNYAPARSLCSKGLLRTVGGTGHMFSWPYTIPDFVWTHLNDLQSEIFPELTDERVQDFLKNFEHHMREFHLYGG
jgi:Super-infection exclusion protein B